MFGKKTLKKGGFKIKPELEDFIGLKVGESANTTIGEKRYKITRSPNKDIIVDYNTMKKEPRAIYKLSEFHVK